MKIFLASGHGGSDPGSIANGTNERDEVERIIAIAVPVLSLGLLHHAEIVHVPNEFAIEQTIKYINYHSHQPIVDICIEIHLNSNVGSPGTGTETFYGSKSLADRINKSVVSVLGLRDRGVKNGNHLWFNNSTNPASCLVELGFINNPTDLKIIQDKGASAIIKAISNFVGVNLEQPQIPDPPKSEQKSLEKALVHTRIREIRNILDDISNLIGS